MSAMKSSRIISLSLAVLLFVVQVAVSFVTPPVPSVTTSTDNDCERAIQPTDGFLEARLAGIRMNFTIRGSDLPITRISDVKVNIKNN